MNAKREHSNLLRLQSIKAKKEEKRKQAEQIKASLSNLDSKTGVLNKRIIFHSDDSGDDANDYRKSQTEINSPKLSLFPSDTEENDDDDIDQFPIRSQFPVPKFAEESCDPRFQLNNLFLEGPDAEDQAVESSDEKTETQKNMEILESVLGYKLHKNEKSGGAKKNKRMVRFDPDDESSWKYLLGPAEPKAEKTLKKEENTTSEPQVSPVRYFEVSADLKNVLQETDKEFRLSKVFELRDGQHETNGDEFDKSNMSQSCKSPPLDYQSSITNKKIPAGKSESLGSSSMEASANEERRRNFKFFILPGDPRLTRGIEKFRRHQSEEEIREDFLKNRQRLLEMWKERQRRGLKALKSPYVRKK